MNVQTIVDHLESFAPLAFQEDFDNCGLLVGNRNQEVEGILICLDVTEDVVDEAISTNHNMIISHHPIIFKGLKSLTGRNEGERCVMKAIKHDIAIYAAHTNLDNAPDGVNFRIAQKLNLENVQVLAPKSDMLLKLVTFVPTSHLEKVRNALFIAGAGHIGEYDSCSFSHSGEGTFRPGVAAKPFIGVVGEIHHEPEIRLEVIVPKYKQSAVISALMQSHPYEEPALDLIPLANKWKQVGLGVVGDLPKKYAESDFLKHVKETFKSDVIKHSPLLNRDIRRVALCGGSGADFIPYAKAVGADAFVTADVTYHRFFEAENNLLILDVGHFESEQYTKEIFFEQLIEKFPNFAIRLSTSEKKRVFSF
ncbi:MAG TPA: Nif3-like dinuclear metal center hexameric protein [Paludibacteraceae bacterium]|nr:Nif3-like dinuclear metal center hexameric protein [Paludibacteraceae bacterium]HQB69102.1 Nif3-like dinuclear metal center hexameric protein [Paludibacteraceae bacterium]HRS67536.1 Nif3-like dinuclear metal center hexameric protein [Paludibacteraceae bacterium]